jgi:hypothetical protein
MATLAIMMFVGITVLAHAYKVVPNATESGISQLGRAIFGGPNALYFDFVRSPDSFVFRA